MDLCANWVKLSAIRPGVLVDAHLQMLRFRARGPRRRGDSESSRSFGCVGDLMLLAARDLGPILGTLYLTASLPFAHRRQQKAGKGGKAGIRLAINDKGATPPAATA